jgi:hypothetical protein
MRVASSPWPAAAAAAAYECLDVIATPDELGDEGATYAAGCACDDGDARWI